MELTKQEQIFFKRVAIKMVNGADVATAMQEVCDDDKRIFDAVVSLTGEPKREFESAFAASVYNEIRARQ